MLHVDEISDIVPHYVVIIYLSNAWNRQRGKNRCWLAFPECIWVLYPIRIVLEPDASLQPMNFSGSGSRTGTWQDRSSAAPAVNRSRVELWVLGLWRSRPSLLSPAPLCLPSFFPFRRGIFHGPVAKGGDPLALAMPVPVERCHTTASACLVPPAPINTHQPGVATSLLYSGSQFRGYQKSKGNAYEVEVAVQVNFQPRACPRLACLFVKFERLRAKDLIYSPLRGLLTAMCLL